MKLKYIIILFIFYAMDIYAGIGIGTENCYCFRVSFNNKLIEYKLPDYNISEFKKVRRGAKKENPEDLYKYAIFVLTNNEHNLLDIDKEFEKEFKKRTLLLTN